MNLWQVIQEFDECDEQHCLAIWAWGSDEAIQLWMDGYPADRDARQAKPEVELMRTRFQPVIASPYIERRNEVLRDIGWMGSEDDPICCACGLYSFGDLVPVCDECNCCVECCDCELAMKGAMP